MMLEVRDLKKVYKVKKADPVPALDGVSLKFPDTGLVFILGKSGSGKSTLLNVMGGLDLADSGEIVINGKSSKDFNSSEMDSYRNTYLGFIFQEYNILNDFTVRENIALALELQHKKATNEIIDNILEEVDLVGYGRRKPNELSGGQKQRVAIARALVKEPKILFGDEPTGALDSATGLAVFETLKKLSKTRLVVVVSHDRDFAERFGDRVIELKDGKVISDITKIVEETDEADVGVSLFGSNLIRFEKGHKLTQEDINLINKKLEATEIDAYFSTDVRVNDSIAGAAMINEDGLKESFIETDNEFIEQRKEKWRVVKSKFPMGAAFRMGSKSLRVKPFRLFMTILLSFAAFAMFGLTVCFARVNDVSATVNSLVESDENMLIFTRRSPEGENFSANVKNELKQKTGVDFDLIAKNGSNININYLQWPSNSYSYYAMYFSGVMELSSNTAKKYGLALSSGTYPANKDEIVISKDIYNTIKAGGIQDATDPDIKITAAALTEENIIGMHVSDYDYNTGATRIYKIVGVVDTGLDITPFEALKTATSWTQEIGSLQNELSDLRRSGLHDMLFVSQEYISTYVEAKQQEYTSNIINDGGIKYRYTKEGYSSESEEDVTLYIDQSNAVYFNSEKTSLGENEVLVTPYTFAKIYASEQGADPVTYESLTVEFDDIHIFDDNGYMSTYSSVINAEYLLQEAYKMAGGEYVYRVVKDAFEYKDTRPYDPRIGEVVYNHLGSDKIKGYPGELEVDENGYHVVNWDAVDASLITDVLMYMYRDYGREYYTDYWDWPNSIYYEWEGLEDWHTKYVEVYNEIRQRLVTEYLSTRPYALFTSGTKIYHGSYYELKMFIKDNIDDFINDPSSSELLAKYKTDYSITHETLTENEKYSFGYWYFERIINYYGDTDFDTLVGKEEYAFYNKYQTKINSDFKALLTATSVTIPALTFNITIQTRGESGRWDDRVNTNYQVTVVGMKNISRKGSSYGIQIVTREEEIQTMIGNYLNLNYSYAISPMIKDRATLTKVVSLYYTTYKAYREAEYSNSVTYYTLQSPLVGEIYMWVSLIGELEQIFLYVGIGFAAFAMLLFYNFISISINNKRHEIGILRAVGARGADVFKIFYSEAFIISMINFVLAVGGAIGAVIAINKEMGKAIPGLVLLNFGVIEILIVLALSLFASFISSLLPVIKIARQKPIDAIREK